MKMMLIQLPYNYALKDLFQYKSQSKLNYVLRSFYSNFLTIDVALSYRKPITIFGFNKDRVKSLKIMKKWKILQDEVTQLY